jgi:hypothetical protein
LLGRESQLSQEGCLIVVTRPPDSRDSKFQQYDAPEKKRYQKRPHAYDFGKYQEACSIGQWIDVMTLFEQSVGEEFYGKTKYPNALVTKSNSLQSLQCLFLLSQ